MRVAVAGLVLISVMWTCLALIAPGAAAGRARPDALPGYKVVEATFDASFATGEGRVLCARGKVVLGGGYELHSVQGGDPFTVLASAPLAPGSGWRVAWDNLGGGAVSATVDVYAICATA